MREGEERGRKKGGEKGKTTRGSSRGSPLERNGKRDRPRRGPFVRFFFINGNDRVRESLRETREKEASRFVFRTRYGVASVAWKPGFEPSRVGVVGGFAK